MMKRFGVANRATTEGYLTFLLPVLISMAMPAYAGEATKQTVGAVETIIVKEADISFEARIDTGAESSSMHAIQIHVSEPDAEMPRISFVVINRNGEARRIHSKVDSMVRVRNAEGSSVRYKVPLTVRWRGYEKTVLFTLKSRINMHYRVLLGRNWLRGDYLVDVDRTPAAVD